MAIEGNLQLLMASVAVIRANAALPAAGADWTSEWFAIKGASWLTLRMIYERGGAGGSVRFYIQDSHSGPLGDGSAALGAYTLTALQVGAVAAGAWVETALQPNRVTYEAITANAESFVYGPIHLAGTSHRFRMVAHELGAVGTPGDFYVVAQTAASEVS